MARKLLMNPDDWARHEENTAKEQVELRSRGWSSCDIGYGPALLVYGIDTLQEAFGPVILTLSEGLHVAYFYGQLVYIYRRKYSADVMVMEEMMSWFGEDAVMKIDACFSG